MKLAIKTLLTASALTLAAFMTTPGAALAAPCIVDLTNTIPDGRLADATDCGTATPANHSEASTQAALNADNPGGLNLTFTFIDRDPRGPLEAEDALDAAFAITGTSSGTWLINTDVISSAYDTFVVTMKDGAPLSNQFLWFLIDTSAGANACSTAQSIAGWDLCGTWTMYGDNNGAPTPKNVSHMDLFAADNPGGGGSGLPEPGSVALLGLVMGTIGLVSRRRR